MHSAHAEPGLKRLQFENKREALLYVPPSAIGSSSPLAVMLHGAGGNAQQGLALLHEYADEARLIVLAPESRRASWDLISDSQYGPDVSLIDGALETVFAQFPVDSGRIALGGFSDGASYALSLGISNGSLFRCILAFSPGFMMPVRFEDEPRVYVSHGIRDEVLPIDPCGRRVASLLRQYRIQLRYREFDGPHTVPPEVKAEAIQWFLDRGSANR
jgi:phospholipase/carboxylesterase